MRDWWAMGRGESLGLIGISLFILVMPWLRGLLTPQFVPVESTDPALLASIHDLRKKEAAWRSGGWMGDSLRIVKLRPGQQLELNSADTLALRRLRGVGAATARRIVDYRQRLGGFLRAEQLLEVYGMDSLTYEVVLKYLTLDTGFVKPLDVNGLDLEGLADHPYVGWNLAKKIVAYRRQHGPYTRGVDLLKILALDSLDRCRLAPYLAR
jgi:competence ComEA-like helix-hairpin-helix protein